MYFSILKREVNACFRRFLKVIVASCSFPTADVACEFRQFSETLTTDDMQVSNVPMDNMNELQFFALLLYKLVGF